MLLPVYDGVELFPVYDGVVTSCGKAFLLILFSVKCLAPGAALTLTCSILDVCTLEHLRVLMFKAGYF